MKCPKCGYRKSEVIESRYREKGYVYRRRECYQCRFRFTTAEIYEWMAQAEIEKIAKEGTGIEGR